MSSNEPVTVPVSEQREARLLIQSAFDLAHELGLRTVIIQADEMSDVRLIQKMNVTKRLIWLVRGEEFKQPEYSKVEQRLLPIPDTSLSRMSQVKIGVFLAIFNGFIDPDESVLCVCGVAGSERLDTVMISNPKRDFPWLKQVTLSGREPLLATKEFARLVDIALLIAAEGREGHPIGTTFVLGSRAELRKHLRQLVLNPFSGHRPNRRDIHNPDIIDTVREFAALDGAFIVSRKGKFASAGTYLEAETSRVRLRSGLGARHRSAAALTAVTNSVALVVSSSSRNVTIFHRGQTLLELEDAGEK